MAFFVILNVFKLINITFIEQKFGDVNVWNLKFKLLIIVFKLYNIIPIIWNLVCIFFLFIEMKKICLKIKEELFLMICIKYIHLIFGIFCHTQFSKNWNVLYQKIERYEMKKKYTKNNNIHFLAIIIEFDNMMTVIIIQNQRLIFICCTKFNTTLKCCNYFKLIYL